jgi:hypothetical protein
MKLGWTKGVIGLVIGCLQFVVASADRGPSTPEERDTAIKGARLLESDPLGPDAKEIRHWFTMWVIEVPDIHVSVCSILLGDEIDPKNKKKYGAEVIAQMMYSSTAFVIEHPDQATDEVAMYLAGVQGALRAYESILKLKPKARWAYLDGLIQKRDQGTLQAYIAAQVPACNTSNQS